jgi:hypothetical protein
MVEKPPNALAVTTPFAERMEGCPPSPLPIDGFPPPATVLIVKLCPTQTLRNKKRPQAVFVISRRHVTICGKMAEHHYREECFSHAQSQQHLHIGKNSGLGLQPRDRVFTFRMHPFPASTDVHVSGGINGFVVRQFFRPRCSASWAYWNSAASRRSLVRESAVKPVGKPDAGNRHVRFDERGSETGRR